MSLNQVRTLLEYHSAYVYEWKVLAQFVSTDFRPLLQVRLFSEGLKFKTMAIKPLIAHSVLVDLHVGAKSFVVTVLGLIV